MHIPPLIASDIPAWFDKYLDKIVAGAGVVFMGLFTVYSNRHSNRLNRRDDQRDKRREKSEEGAANIEIEHIRALDKEQERKTQEVKDLRAEFLAYQERSGKRIDILESRTSILITAYGQCYGALVQCQQTIRTLKARLRRADPSVDPDAEFPDLKTDDLTPMRVLGPIQGPVSVTVFQSPSDPKKMTSVVTTGLPPR